MCLSDTDTKILYVLCVCDVAAMNSMNVLQNTSYSLFILMQRVKNTPKAVWLYGIGCIYDLPLPSLRFLASQKLAAVFASYWKPLVSRSGSLMDQVWLAT